MCVCVCARARSFVFVCVSTIELLAVSSKFFAVAMFIIVES